MATISHAYHQAFAEPFAITRAFDADYLLYASSGTFTLEAGDRRWMLPPQRAALIARGTEISVGTTGAVTASSVLFADGVIDVSNPCRVFGVSDLARQMILHAMRWPEQRAPDTTAGTFFEALAGVVGELAENEDETWMPRARSEAVAAAIRLLLDRLNEDVSFASLADAARLSERTLARRFDEELGMNFRDFRQRARMVRAKEMLAAGREPVTAVGFACGFESTSSFVKAFRMFAGVTPGQYRRGLA